MLAPHRLALLGALAAAVQINAEELKFTSPEAGSSVNLTAESIKISWESIGGSGDDDYQKLELRWYVSVRNKEGSEGTSMPIADLSLPNTTEYDWDPETAREKLKELQERGTSPQFSIEYTLSSSNSDVEKKQSEQKFPLEGVESSGSVISRGSWVGVGAGLAALAGAWLV
ncbi:hypothetical protein ACHAQA_006090 [Verticillium albo-atrum]